MILQNRKKIVLYVSGWTTYAAYWFCIFSCSWLRASQYDAFEYALSIDFHFIFETVKVNFTQVKERRSNMQGNDEIIYPFSKTNLGFFLKMTKQFQGSLNNKDKKYFVHDQPF